MFKKYAARNQRCCCSAVSRGFNGDLVFVPFQFTLPFAWKYSRCLDLLIERGLARSVSYFALEM